LCCVFSTLDYKQKSHFLTTSQYQHCKVRFHVSFERIKMCKCKIISCHQYKRIFLLLNLVKKVELKPGLTFLLLFAPPRLRLYVNACRWKMPLPLFFKFWTVRNLSQNIFLVGLFCFEMQNLRLKTSSLEIHLFIYLL